MKMTNIKMAFIIFFTICLMSVFTLWMSGWDGERNPMVSFWVGVTLFFGVFLGFTPIALGWYKEDNP